MKRYKIKFVDEVIEVEGILFFLPNDYRGPVPTGDDYIFINTRDVVYVHEVKRRDKDGI